MAMKFGRLLTGQWARRKPYYLFSPLHAHAAAAFNHAAVGEASFCTEFDASQSSRVKVFDRDLKTKQRDRAAWLMGGKNDFVDSVAENLLDRLEDCKKTFPTALCLGGSSMAIRNLIRGRGGIEKLIIMDTSLDMVKRLKDTEQNFVDNNIETFYIVGDEEFLPIKENTVDLVVSCLGLHWTNDLPGAMIQAGIEARWSVSCSYPWWRNFKCGFLARELRIACTIAQLEREGGISPRMSPLAQVRDAGNLLTRAGFALPGVDVDEYTVTYQSGIDRKAYLTT